MRKFRVCVFHSRKFDRLRLVAQTFWWRGGPGAWSPGRVFDFRGSGARILHSDRVVQTIGATFGVRFAISGGHDAHILRLHMTLFPVIGHVTGHHRISWLIAQKTLAVYAK